MVNTKKNENYFLLNISLTTNLSNSFLNNRTIRFTYRCKITHQFTFLQLFATKIIHFITIQPKNITKITKQSSNKHISTHST